MTDLPRLNVNNLHGIQLDKILEIVLLSFNTLYEKHKPACTNSEACEICAMYHALTERLDRLVANRDRWDEMIMQCTIEREQHEKKEAAKPQWLYSFVFFGMCLFITIAPSAAFVLSWRGISPIWEMVTFIPWAMLMAAMWLKFRDHLSVNLFPSGIKTTEEK